MKFEFLHACWLTVIITGTAFGQGMPSGKLTRSSPNSLLDIGPPGSPDDNKTGPRVVLKMGPQDYRMWYEAVPGPNQSSVGFATSNNGVIWTKQGIVLTPSADWEGGPNGEVSPNSILIENGLFQMWYHSYDFATPSHRRIGLATSTNGLNWEKHPVPVLDVGTPGSLDDKMVVEPRVFKVDNAYRMYYGGMSFASSASGYALCMAMSPDGTNWTKYVRNPLPGIPARTGAAGYAIIQDQNIWYMWHGKPSSDAYGGLYFAWSSNGISWVEGTNNPVLSAKSSVSGAYDSQGSGDSISVYRDDDLYRVLYTGLIGFDARLGFWPERIMMATVSASGSSVTNPPVQVLVDNSRPHQVMMGFGATHGTGMSGNTDYLTPSQRAEAIDKVYGQIKITTGNVEGALLESPGDYSQRRNDNNDPFSMNWSGFQTGSTENIINKLLNLAQPVGFTSFYLAQKVNVRWASPWLDALRKTNYSRYLDEAAEQVLAGHFYWRDRRGIEPEFQMLFNEPLSGNRELLNGTTQDVVDLVKRVGARLQQAGFQVKFVVPNEETEEKTLEAARAILLDPEARQYVGAIGYHPYPYESWYANIPNILNTSGRGMPNSQRIAVRNQLRELARQYGLPLWMTEVSNGGVNPLSYDDFRGRAIHIHDELVYADAAAYYGMLNFWDTKAARDHGLSSNLTSSQHEGTLVMVDTMGNGGVYITGMGYAIGHYSRWLDRGAVRMEASSSEPLIQLTAFRDDRQNRLTLVLFNNDSSHRPVQLGLKGLRVAGEMWGEQSTAANYWKSLPSVTLSNETNVLLELPALSVTTVAMPITVAPKLELKKGENRNLHLALRSGGQQAYELHASTNLVDWQLWGIITSQESDKEFILTNSLESRVQFFRALRQSF